MTKTDPWQITTKYQAHRKLTSGLNSETVIKLSSEKKEPEWMKRFRLAALDIYHRKELPDWAKQPELAELRTDRLTDYLAATQQPVDTWDKVPLEIKDTFERLGIPQAERQFLGGVSAQFESTVIYGQLRDQLKKKGVIFCDTDTALKKYPDLFKKYFATIVPASDNKFAALNSALWSGGSFIYVPQGVKLEWPLQAYFRINAPQMGQFERTLIIADEESEVNYIEGCTAPVYRRQSLHAAVVEIIALPGAHVRYTTIQNWSKNIFNLVTKRAVAKKNAYVEWIDGNLGSKLTMKYPSVYLTEPGARGDILSIAVASSGQKQDSGGKVLHLADRTRSLIRAKSISESGGITNYRGLVFIAPGHSHCQSRVECDALLVDDSSVSNTYPEMKIQSDQVSVEHEASISRIEDQQCLFLRSRGLTENEARALIVNGFLSPFTKELPMEYAVELNRLINMQMEGSVG